MEEIEIAGCSMVSEPFASNVEPPATTTTNATVKNIATYFSIGFNTATNICSDAKGSSIGIAVGRVYLLGDRGNNCSTTRT